MQLLNNRELGRLDFKRLPFACPTLRVLSRYAIPHDSRWSIVRHDPLQHPELPFRLLLGLTIAHRKIKDLATVIQVNHKLSAAISLAGRRIGRSHSEPDGFASFETIVQYAVARFADAEEVRDVTGQDQSF